MGHSVLRVINQDIVAGHSGFGEHPHDNMEILTHVLRGTLTHRDTLGNTRDITAGEFQLMSAGTGLRHSEMNRHDEPVELLQIWLLPNQRQVTPRYAQRAFPARPGLTCVVAPDDSVEVAAGALPLRQDARVHRGQLAAGEALPVTLGPGRQAWLQLLRGTLTLNAIPMTSGDGAAIAHEPLLQLTATTDSEFLFFDLP